jgi:hypothetical protein
MAITFYEPTRLCGCFKDEYSTEANPPTSNAVFLALYDRVHPDEQWLIEREICEEFDRSSSPNFGLTYIQSLTQASFAQLSKKMQKRIIVQLWQLDRANPLKPTVWGKIFMHQQLP